MAARGFPEKFSRWIFHLLTTASSRIAINCHSSSSFKHKRGLRQGDPISPYLFILAVDVLQQMTRLVAPSLPYLLTPKLQCPFTTLQYADDTIIVASAQGSSLQYLLLVVHCFSQASGLKVNFRKSTFVPLALTPSQIQSIENLMGCRHQLLPITYLGMPLTIKSPTRTDFMPLLHKLETRLHGWKARFISRAGRLQLIKSVLSTIPTYFMSCFQFPKWLLNRIDKIRRQFLWSRTDSQHAIHLINWRTVCLPIKCGGMGVPNLHLQNTSLLTRWLWSLYSSDHKLWHMYATLLCTASRREQTPLLLSAARSFFWKTLLSLRLLFFSCAQFELRSGRQTSFWYDGWSGQPIAPSKPIRITAKRISVYDARGCHSSLLPRPLTFQHHWAIQKLVDFTPRQGTDSLKWTLSHNGTYSVASVYKVLAQGGKTRSLLPPVWKAKVSPSMRCFFYLLLNNRVLTHDVMLRRNIHHTAGCVMCAEAPQEIALHLFLQCPFAMLVWSTLSASMGFPMVCPKDTLLQTFIDSMPTGRPLRKRWMATFITATWLLWRERNDRTFQRKRTTAAVLCSKIQLEARLCLRYC